MRVLFGSDVSADPEPMAQEVVEEPKPRFSTTSLREAKAATASAENILNMILSNGENEPIKAGSKGNLYPGK